MEAINIRPISIVAVSGSFVTIIIPAIELKPKKAVNLCFALYSEDKETFFNSLQGNEPVQIQNGLGSAANPAPVYIVENRIGDVFYSDKLFLNRIYRLVFGNNGAVSAPADLVPPETAVGGLGHFLCYNSPCASRAFDGANVGEQPEASE